MSRLKQLGEQSATYLLYATWEQLLIAARVLTLGEKTITFTHRDRCWSVENTPQHAAKVDGSSADPEMLSRELCLYDERILLC